MPTLNVKWKFRRKSLFRNKTLWLTWRAREHACRFRGEFAPPSNGIEESRLFLREISMTSKVSVFCQRIKGVHKLDVETTLSIKIALREKLFGKVVSRKRSFRRYQRRILFSLENLSRSEIFCTALLSREINSPAGTSLIFFRTIHYRFWNWLQLRRCVVQRGPKRNVSEGAKERRSGKEREREKRRALGLLVFISSVRKIRRRRHLHHSVIFWILAVIRRLAMYSANLYFHPEIIAQNAHEYRGAGEYAASCLSFLPRLCLLPLRFFCNLYRDA